MVLIPRSPALPLAALLLAAAITPVTAQVHTSDVHSFRVDTVVTGLEHPWGMAFLPEGDPSGNLLVTERTGQLRLVRLDGRGQPGADLRGRVIGSVSGVPEVWSSGQGGLLDVALHPQFGQNRLVYLSYSKPGPGGEATTAVIRGRLEGSSLVDVEEILEADAWRRSRVHFGSRLSFGPDGHLFVTIGERGQMLAAQDTTNHQGVTLRLNPDGSVPGDNPFVDVPGAQPEIWTYGNRNPQGLDFDPETGHLWAVEHGPQGGDELNLLRPGVNYGWPAITYGVNYDDSVITDRQRHPDMAQPVHYWVPSIATSGLAIYRGDAFPEWRGDALVGGLRGAQLARVDLQGREAQGWESLLQGFARIRDVTVGPDGTVYLLIDESDAPLVRLVPAG